MFACLEIDTEDIIVWAEIDKILAESLGLTHILWGVDVKSKKPMYFKLPGNLFYVKSSLDRPLDFRELIETTVKNIWTGGYNIIIIKGEQWSHNDRVLSKTIYEDDLEIARE